MIEAVSFVRNCEDERATVTMQYIFAILDEANEIGRMLDNVRGNHPLVFMGATREVLIRISMSNKVDWFNAIQIDPVFRILRLQVILLMPPKSRTRRPRLIAQR